MKAPKEYIKLKNGTLRRRNQDGFRYDLPYWGENGRSTMDEQCFNVHGFKNDEGATKGEAVLKHCRGSTLLEIGCAPGEFMRLAGEGGFSCAGIEPCEAHVPFIVDRSGAPVFCGYFERMEFLPSYDTIVAMDVIEHVADPEGFAAKAVSLLNPGGRLVLMMPAIYDDGEFDVKNFHPEHLNLFSQKHLRQWLQPIIFDRWMVGHEIVVVEK